MRPNELIEFDVNGFRIAILRILDQEDHQKGHDGRSCVDSDLPCVAKAEHRAGKATHTSAASAIMNADGRPVALAIHFANRVKKEEGLCGFIRSLGLQTDIVTEGPRHASWNGEVVSAKSRLLESSLRPGF